MGSGKGWGETAGFHHHRDGIERPKTELSIAAIAELEKWECSAAPYRGAPVQGGRGNVCNDCGAYGSTAAGAALFPSSTIAVRAAESSRTFSGCFAARLDRSPGSSAR